MNSSAAVYSARMPMKQNTKTNELCRLQGLINRPTPADPPPRAEFERFQPSMLLACALGQDGEVRKFLRQRRLPRKFWLPDKRHSGF